MDYGALAEKWKGQVIGSNEEIEAAISELKREPRDFMELEDIIFKNRNEKLNEMLKESFWW